MSRMVKIQNNSNPDAPLIHAKYCGDLWTKFKGLMLQPSLPETGGVLLVEDREGKINTAIHMFFMRFDICAIWINARLEIVDIQIARRWRPAYSPKMPASFILETHVNQINHYHIGDQVSIIHD